MNEELEESDFYSDDDFCETCGSDTHWEDCYDCGGEGFHDDLYEEDPLWYNPGDTEDCRTCKGHGGWHLCTYKNCKPTEV